MERNFEILKLFFSRFALLNLKALFKRGDGIRTKKINFKISKFLFTYLVENLILRTMVQSLLSKKYFFDLRNTFFGIMGRLFDLLKFKKKQLVSH